jgi:hypothetical protein
MNTHLSYLIAQERAADFARDAGRSRLGKEARLANSPRSEPGWASRAMAWLRFRTIGHRTDAALERQHQSVAR